MLALVVVTPRDGISIQQTVGASGLAGGVRRTDFCCSKLGFGAVDLCLVWLRVDGEQRFALAHQRAVFEMDCDDATAHQRTDVNLLNRLHPAGVGLPFGDGLGDDGRHVDLHCRGLLCLGGMSRRDGAAIVARPVDGDGCRTRDGGDEATFETNVFAVVEVTQAFLPLLRAAPAARIVNVSSQLASFGWHTDPSSPICNFKIPAYNASKSVVNSWTVHLAYELRDTTIKVNAIHPGYVQTDMNGGHGEISVPEGAKSSVEMALLAEDGPSGTFTHLGKPLPW